MPLSMPSILRIVKGKSSTLAGAMALARWCRLGWVSCAEGAVLTCNFQVMHSGGYGACHRDHHTSGRHVGRLLERLRGSMLTTNVPRGEPWQVEECLTCWTSQGAKCQGTCQGETGGARWQESVNQSTQEKRRSSRGAQHVHTGSLPLLHSRHALPSKFLKPFLPLLNRCEHNIESLIACRQSLLSR
jgi:hypothetical protein